MLRHFLLAISLTVSCCSKGQGPFEPPAEMAGSKAIFKDSTIIQNWATNCIVTRGYQRIDSTQNGFATAGNSSNATGISDGFTVSLGDAGEAIVSFNGSIYNGSGADFVVFENAFNNTFLELAFVEVSSDGQNFYRFPPTSLTQDTNQINSFGALDATNVNNLAGKYEVFYGTPFDLDELSAIQGLDINNITHVKVIDVVGNVNENYATYDILGNKINDPWPTNFPSSGFDLDAVGVINFYTISEVNELNKNQFKVYPNPTTNRITIQGKTSIDKLEIYSQIGEKLNTTLNQIIDLTTYQKGIYFLKIYSKNQTITKKIIKQ